MFFFEGYTWLNILIAVVILISYLVLNELTRRSKWFSIVFFIFMPLFLGLTLWQTTAIRGDGDWFPLVKTLSALAGVLGFMAIRFIPGAADKKWLLFFPFFILSFNIAEAVFRDFQVFALYSDGLKYRAIDDMMMQGGPWNVINAIAGILNILTLTGWFGIKISKDKSKDMIWPDQLWFWIIAYDVWNMAYCYNCIPTRSMYTGVLLLTACTIAAFAIKKGAWLQHRAQTLAMWGIFSLCLPGYNKYKYLNIVSTNDIAPLYVLSIAALVINVAVFSYEIYKIIKTKRNPVTQDLYTDLKTYKEIIKINNL